LVNYYKLVITNARNKQRKIQQQNLLERPDLLFSEHKYMLRETGQARRYRSRFNYRFQSHIHTHTHTHTHRGEKSH
jgi:hypothetical protein